MPRKKSGAQLLQQWLKKDIIRPGTRIKVLKSPSRAGLNTPLWPTPLIATVMRIDDWDVNLPVGFKPDDLKLNPFGSAGCWWCSYEWVEVLRPEEDPLNTEQVTPSQEVMTG